MKSTMSLFVIGGLLAGGLHLLGVGRDPSETAARNAYILAQANKINAEAQRVWEAARNDRLAGEQSRTFAADQHKLGMFIEWGLSCVVLGLIGLIGLGLTIWLIYHLVIRERERLLVMQAELLRAQAEQMREKRQWLAWMKAQRDNQNSVSPNQTPRLLSHPQSSSFVYQGQVDVRN
jgi:hypothetical protein